MQGLTQYKAIIESIDKRYSKMTLLHPKTKKVVEELICDSRANNIEKWKKYCFYIKGKNNTGIVYQSDNGKFTFRRNKRK